ncbi:MAG: M36 family metallopeptidase, partial [Planctomycetota bacterium]|nr:M36 family metallopeptidase [Planctomycetota bacterium]
TTGANNLALQLFVDGMKYSMINPTFTQARDGILAADQALTGGVNHDALWRAFSRRGLGFGADGGFTTVQVPILTGYDMPPTPADITGNIFIDADGDGVRQVTEAPLPGVTVYMDLNDNGTHERLEPWQITDVDGNYSFELYLGGPFSIKALPQTNFRQTLPDPIQFEGGPINDGGHDVYVVTGASTDDVDFGFKPSGQAIGIFGTKFGDENANGVQDPGELGIAGVYIYADLDNDSRIDVGEPAAITDEDGNYNLVYNEAGPVTIREVLDPGYVQTAPAGGQNDITMILGLPSLDVDFGNNEVIDFGDAPDTYDAAGAASHGIVEGLFMGAGVDAEVDAQSGAFADGDDNSDTDDEDGVTFTSALVADAAATVDIEISASDISRGVIQAWLDFDADGVFDSDEQIIADGDVVAGTNTFTFDIPAGATLGDTYARFRYGYERGLGPNGPALAGEVEDYAIGVLTDQPLAVDDRFEVDVNSEFSTLLVLQNDLESSTPPNTVVGVTSGDSGAIIQIAPGGTHVLYKPALGDIDGDSFDYTIQDNAGNQSVATVTIVHLQPSESYPDLFAVDDYEVIIGDATAPLFTDIDVAANDHSGQADPVVVLAVIDGPSNGTASIHSGELRYTPNAGFFGLDKLTYTITNALGVETHKGNVAIQVTTDGNHPTDDDISYIVQAIHPTSGALVDSIDIEVGEIVTVQVSTQDGRPVAAGDAGIFAAYLDLIYGRNNLQIITDSLSFDASFPNQRSGDLSVPGLVNEAGAFQDISVINSSAPEPVFTVDFRGLNPGTTTVQADPADIVSDSPVPGTSPLHDTLTINPAAPVAHNDINFGSLVVAVTSGSGEGELDINQDGAVTALDALNIINNLNTNGSRSLAEGESLSYDQRLDVNRDEYITSMDALSIINYLNHRSELRGGIAEGEFTPAVTEQATIDTDVAGVDIRVADAPEAAVVDEWMRVRENEIGLSMFTGGNQDSMDTGAVEDLETAIEEMAGEVFGEWL